MKKTVICLCLYLHMTTILLTGCSSADTDSATPIQESSDTVPETDQSEETSPDPVLTDTTDMTPEEHLNYIFNRYNSQGQKGYLVYRGSNWNTILQDEKILIDTISQIVYREKENAESNTAEPYYLTSENGIDYLYLSSTETTDGYIKISGHPQISYTVYTMPLAVPTSTTEYQITDFSISRDPIKQNADGVNTQDLNLFYTKSITTDEGTVVVLDVVDIFTVNTDTHNLISRIIEAQDSSEELSAYNFVEEYHYLTGEDAQKLDHYLPAYAYAIPSITFEEYSTR